MRVDVAIIHYNQPDYLHKALVSALSQTHNDVRITVYDDHSDEEPVVPEMVRLVRREENSGSALWGWNKAIEDSDGDFLIILSADDELMPDACEVVCQQSGDWVYGDLEVIDRYGNVCDYYDYSGWPHDPVEALLHTYAEKKLSMTMLAAFRVSWLRSNNLRAVRFEDMKECADTATGIIWLAHCPEVSYLQRPLFRYRRYSGSETDDIDRFELARSIEGLIEKVMEGDSCKP